MFAKQNQPTPTHQVLTTTNQVSTRRSTIPKRKCDCGDNLGILDNCKSCQKNDLTGKPPLLQPKLTVNHPGDRYEQEADRVADTIMRMSVPAIQKAPT